MTPRPLILVGIVEADAYHAASLQRILESSADIVVVGNWRDVRTALHEISRQTANIVLIDIQSPKSGNMEIIRKLAAVPQTKVLVYTSCEDLEYIVKSLKAGASGYLLKKDNDDSLAHSIRELWAGGAPLSGTIVRKLVHYLKPPEEAEIQCFESLTKRETEVLSLLAQGRLYKEVARQLGITMQTTKKHVQNIFGKLDAQNNIEAINKWRSVKPYSNGYEYSK